MTTVEHKIIMTRFADWLKHQDIAIVQDADGPIWNSSYQGGPEYSSDELIAIFYQHLDLPK